MLKGFKEFISRGNVVELAVGVIMATSFSPVVANLTNNVLMPLIAGVFGQPNFDAVGAFTIGGAQILPGTVITAVVNFLIVAFAVYFFVVVPMNRLTKIKEDAKNASEAAEAAEAADTTPADIALLTEIRDLLRK